MAAPLRVNPDSLRSAAASQAEVGTFMSSIGTGQVLTGAAGALPGLACAAACNQAGTVLDRVAGELAAALTTHSERLTLAADLYVRADEEFGRRLHNQVM